MARPIKETVDYFSHDGDASEGRTLSILENHFGHEGYSAWFKLLERVSRTRNHVIPIENTEDLEFLAAKMRFQPERLREILSKMAELDAIDRDLYAHGLIWSQNFVDRLLPLYRERKQQIPVKPELSGGKTELLPRETEFSGGEIPQSKVKESKVNNIPPLVPQGTLLSKKTETKQTGAVVVENQVTSGENPPSRTKFVLPDWIKPETWSAFKEMRQKSRAPLTDSAAKLLLHKLARFRADGDDPNLVLEQSIMAGYRGVFALKQGQASPAKKGGNFGRANGDQKPDAETSEQHMQRLKDSIIKPF